MPSRPGALKTRPDTVALRARWPDLEATAHAADPSLAWKSSILD